MPEVPPHTTPVPWLLALADRAKKSISYRSRHAAFLLARRASTNRSHVVPGTARLRILYLSCHSVLKHDETTLLRELGHYVFSPPASVDGIDSESSDLRELHAVRTDEELEDFERYLPIGAAAPPGTFRLPTWFVNRFDLVIVMHRPDWIEANWLSMRHVPVIWRTIGQSDSAVERCLAGYRKRGLRIVRYSPKEENLRPYVGADALIRFYKDPEEYRDWNGSREEVLSIVQAMPTRARECHYDLFTHVARDLPVRLYGPGNEAVGPAAMGMVSHAGLKQALRDFRCFFYLGTLPASYTLGFMEAWMTGTPVVAIGDRLMSQGQKSPSLYEVPELIEHGVTGFIADSEDALRATCRELLRDASLAQAVSRRGREAAMRAFGKDAIKEEWKKYLAAL